MALSGLKTNTEFLPSIRFNAREGVFSRVDRSLDAEGKWANELVKLELWLSKSTSDGSPLREFSHTAAGVKNGINDLHTAWERGAENIDPVEREAGEIVPLVKIVIDNFKTKNGTFYKPTFEIAGWIPRPVEWTMSVPVAATPNPPQISDAPASGTWVEAPASPAADDDLPF